MEKIAFGEGRHVVWIAAVDAAFGLGKNGGIPWDYPEDRAFFRGQTMGHVVVMGRRTYDGLRVRPRAGRPMGVLTHRPVGEAGVEVSQDIGTLMAWGLGRSEIVYVAGGATVYEATRPWVTDIVLSRVPGEYGCDVGLDGAFLGRGWTCREERRVGSVRVEHWEREGWGGV